MATEDGYRGVARVEEMRRVTTRHAIRAACFGFFVDMFDVYLPITAMVPALVYFTPAGLSGTSKATIFYLVFSASLIGRPVGALIFGYFGDSLGRRRTILVSVVGLSFVTLIIAMLQGHAAWGGYSITALITLRLLNGVFVGGEYTGANPPAWNTHRRTSGSIHVAIRPTR